jgi:hypothetical protein
MNIKSINPIILTLAASAILLSACGGGDSSKPATNADVKQAESSQVSSSESPANEQKAVLKAQLESAKKTTKIFGSTLKGELQKAMKAGGPVNALTVCNTKAIPITEKVAKEQGAQLSRVSLKNRNPKNVPNEWQKAVLEDFDARAAKGEDVKAMAFAKMVEDGGKKQFRFMKALPTGKLCLRCHGSKLAPEVSAKLAELYPEDKATGYKPGQVRGAIVITKDL